jgi:hypothetical protein
MARYWQVIILLGLTITLIAKAGCSTPVIFPQGCLPTGFSFLDKQVILTGPMQQQQQVYLLRNNSREPIYLDHPADYPGTASAGWMSRLDPGQWSALAVDKPRFTWTCQRAGMAFLDYVACRDVLQICQFAQLKTNADNTGEYWIASNTTLSKLLNTIKLRGITTQ